MIVVIDRYEIYLVDIIYEIHLIYRSCKASPHRAGQSPPRFFRKCWNAANNYSKNMKELCQT